MKFLLVLLLVISPITDLNEIASVNERKKAAEEAYLKGDYEEAALHYRYLIDSLNVTEESVLLNLANSLFNLQDSANARSVYSDMLSNEASKKSQSIAHQQLGLIDYGAKKYKEALNQFKNSLRNDPSNEDARYNYELLKKLLKEQEEQEKQKQDKENQDNQENQDQQQQDQQNQDQKQDQQNKEDQQDQEKQDQESEDQENQKQQEQKDGEKSEQEQQEEGEETDEKPEDMDPTTAEKLEEMNISEEKAKMILEALKNSEIQYIQQNKRKATKRKKDGKPDW